ncbi:hypothetical protein G6011_00917 [Alternaria panax]|uniref:Amidohydrolase 3 domain-containing protein n=1 Tax=Alternaria panax TaxID=48097 RepID=A0AAD4IK16_9PLEO|nr:hypothetical protein G6011_00917 [Alternaria panax]
MDYSTLISRNGRFDKASLDTLKTKQPVIIRPNSYHTVLVGSQALEMCNIIATAADPSGGVTERLPGSKEPSGVLQYNASDLLSLPLLSLEEAVQAARAAMQLLRQSGIITLQEAKALVEYNQVFQALQQEVELIPILVAESVKLIKRFDSNSTMHFTPSLKWQAVKMFLNGVITYPTSTVALIEPYWSLVNGSDSTWAPEPGPLRKTYWESEILTRTLSDLWLAEVDARIHADGDLAVRIGLVSAESFRKAHPGHDFRLGLAHDEPSHQDDWVRFKELEVDAIMNFQWSQLVISYIPSTFLSLADYNRQNLQAYAEIEKAGRPITYGSNWPVDPLDSFLALKIAVTRSGDPADKYIGSPEVGKFADLVVLKNDCFTVPKEMIGRQKVQLTMAGGKVVYIADEADQKFGIITAKYPKNDPAKAALNHKAIDGLDGKQVSIRGAVNGARLRKRHECVHN